jgi:hypothetical protein
MSEVTEQIASVLDLIPIELRYVPNDLIGLLIRAKAEIDAFDARLKAEYMEGYETGILQNANKYFPRLQGGYDGSVD